MASKSLAIAMDWGNLASGRPVGRLQERQVAFDLVDRILILPSSELRPRPVERAVAQEFLGGSAQGAPPGLLFRGRPPGADRGHRPRISGEGRGSVALASVPVAPDAVQSARQDRLSTPIDPCCRGFQERPGRLGLQEIVERDVGRLDLALRFPGSGPEDLRRPLPECEGAIGVVESVAEQAGDHPHDRDPALRIQRLAPEDARLTCLGGPGR